jgi:hypothetical protein
MPDKPKEDEDVKKKEGATAEVDVSALLDGFKDTMAVTVKEVAEATRAAATPAASTGPTPEEIAARATTAREKYAEARTKANELITEGDAAAAFETLYQGAMEVQAATAVPVEDRPELKAVIASTKRVVKSDHKDIFKKYGTEIEADMAGLPATDQMNPDVWDAAVNRAKSAHIDEILEDRIKAKEDADEAERADANFDTPMARGGGRRTTRSEGDVDVASLSKEQTEVAKACGLSKEDYASAVTRYAKTSPNKQGNIPILDEDPHPRIKPGQF